MYVDMTTTCIHEAILYTAVNVFFIFVIESHTTRLLAFPLALLLLGRLMQMGAISNAQQHQI